MKANSNNRTNCCIPCLVYSKKKDEFCSEEADTKIDMDHISLSPLISSERNKHNDGEHHAQDGHGEAEVCDVCQLHSMEIRVIKKAFMNIEDESKICEMIT